MKFRYFRLQSDGFRLFFVNSRTIVKLSFAGQTIGKLLEFFWDKLMFAIEVCDTAGKRPTFTAEETCPNSVNGGNCIFT
jgi:hypothetical protein